MLTKSYRNGVGKFKCGAVNARATQRMEIFADTVRDVNADNLFPNVKMGFTILDDCDVTRVSIKTHKQIHIYINLYTHLSQHYIHNTRIYTHTYTLIYKHTYTNKHIHTSTHTQLHVCKLINTYTHNHIHIYTHTDTYTHT